MTVRIPLGERESFRLEFKGRDALAHPETIAREVVGFLNAEGGVVWVGLREEEGRAVAIEPVDELQKIRLRDFLVDTLEPTPTEQEVWIQRVESEEGEGVLLVEATPRKESRPYSFMKKGGRDFPIRIADRLRQMTREEIRERFRNSLAVGGEVEETIQKILEERQQVQKDGKPLLWLRLQPVGEIKIDVQEPRLEKFLTDPQATGNRPEGWTFASSQQRPKLSNDKLVTLVGEGADDVRRAEVQGGGGLLFSVPLTWLHYKGDQRELGPLFLLEYPVSALRIAAQIFERELAPEVKIACDFALISLNGWCLRGGTPGTWFFISPANDCHEYEEDDFLLEKPAIFTSKQICGEPDACAWRLLERVYEAFGFRRHQMPEFFDPIQRRVTFTS
jgi:Putative DNA-binding domain